MSNNQWNNGQGDGQWQPQGNQEWSAAPQPSAADWNAPQGEPQATDWNAGAEPQQSADWNQAAGQQDWNQAPQPQGSADWNQGQPAQDWNQAQQPAQQWNQQPGAYGAQGQQWQQAPAQRSNNSGFGTIFDFSFKKFALPEAAGMIFLIAVIAIGVWWLFDLVAVIQLGGSLGASYTLQGVLGGLAKSLLYILLARVLIEGASAVVKISEKTDEVKETTED